ncbi:MAG: hypothetical protein K9N51_13055 [Candidatus Pacebacteria bacterium]|nr:hypothetical protein [Candidatus Paceibacterota bacterium]
MAKHGARSHVKTILTTMLAAALLWTASAMAQDYGSARRTVEIRFVRADNKKADETEEALADILPLLRQNLRFTRYRLISRRTVALSEGQRIPLAYGYTLNFSNVQSQALTVHIFRQQQMLLRTRLRLKSRRPVLLGGFPHAGDSTLIAVLKLMED